MKKIQEKYEIKQSTVLEKSVKKVLNGEVKVYTRKDLEGLLEYLFAEGILFSGNPLQQEIPNVLVGKYLNNVRLWKK